MRISIIVTDSDCDALIATAVNAGRVHGIGYWIQGKATWRGHSLTFTTIDDKRVTVTRAVVRRGLRRLLDAWLSGERSLPYGASDGLDGWDGPAADTVIQLGLFGKEIYG